MNLFLSRGDIEEIVDVLERARVKVRAAERFTTKIESPSGQSAHRSLHEAETAIASALKTLRGD